MNIFVQDFALGYLKKGTSWIQSHISLFYQEGRTQFAMRLVALPLQLEER